MKEFIALSPVTLEHKNKVITISHDSGMKVAVGADRLRSWALGLLRKELTLDAPISDAHVSAVDSMMGSLDK